MGFPLTPAPLLRAAARFANAGLGGGGSCVVDGEGLARLASRSAAIFSLRDGGGSFEGVVSGKGGRESRSDCRLRTARSMDGSRPELARASRYILKASSEWRRGEGFCGAGTVGETGVGEEKTYAFRELPAVDEGVVALLRAGGEQGVEKGELLCEVVWVGVDMCFKRGDLCGGVEGRCGWRGGGPEEGAMERGRRRAEEGAGAGQGRRPPACADGTEPELEHGQETVSDYITCLSRSCPSPARTHSPPSPPPPQTPHPSMSSAQTSPPSSSS